MDQRCGRCKVTKDVDQFSPSYRGKSGTWCRACFAAHQRGERGTTVPNDPQVCHSCGADYVPAQVKKNARFCSVKCKDAERKASGRSREGHLLRKFGITPDDYDAMLAAQNGGCALCGVAPADQSAKYRDYLHVDHDHVTGRVRGLLCGEHNMLLGRFNDNPAVLRRAADYLEAGAS